AGVGGVAGALVDDPGMDGEVAAPAVGGRGIDLHDGGVCKLHRIGGDARRMARGGAPAALLAAGGARVIGQAEAEGDAQQADEAKDQEPGGLHVGVRSGLGRVDVDQSGRGAPSSARACTQQRPAHAGEQPEGHCPHADHRLQRQRAAPDHRRHA
ncbi:hypothetical protein RZS08_35220, partial [Arthrospira platensis SPKY1]|nr:hypothetical protein [Arthrospira platensis SPKY1]